MQVIEEREKNSSFENAPWDITKVILLNIHFSERDRFRKIRDHDQFIVAYIQDFQLLKLTYPWWKSCKIIMMDVQFFEILQITKFLRDLRYRIIAQKE